MRREELLTELRSARQELDALLGELTDAELSEPGATGEWSVRDVLNHITWYELEEAALLRQAGEEASRLWELPYEARNTAIQEQRRELPAAVVRADFERAHLEMLEGVERLSDSDLITPGRFPGTSDDRLPWFDIATNSYLHEREHLEMLSGWLERRRGGTR